jgi:acyl carrier protein
MEARAALASFFAERGKALPGAGVDLFESEAIDSMELLELVMWLEERHGIDIPQEAMSVDNFRTLERMAATVAQAA